MLKSSLITAHLSYLEEQQLQERHSCVCCWRSLWISVFSLRGDVQRVCVHSGMDGMTAVENKPVLVANVHHHILSLERSAVFLRY